MCKDFTGKTYIIEERENAEGLKFLYSILDGEKIDDTVSNELEDITDSVNNHLDLMEATLDRQIERIEWFQSRYTLTWMGERITSETTSAIMTNIATLIIALFSTS